MKLLLSMTVALLLSSLAVAEPRYLSRTRDGAAYGLRNEIDRVASMLDIETGELLKLIGSGSEGRERFLASEGPEQKALEQLLIAILDEEERISDMGPRANMGTPSYKQMFEVRMLALSGYCKLQIKKPQMRWVFDSVQLYKSLSYSEINAPNLLNYALIALMFDSLTEDETENPNDFIRSVGTARNKARARAEISGASDPDASVASAYEKSALAKALERAELEATARKSEPTLSQTFLRNLDRAFQQVEWNEEAVKVDDLWAAVKEMGALIHSARSETFSNPSLGFAFQQIPRDLTLERFGDESTLGSDGHGYWQVFGSLPGRDFDSIGEASNYFASSFESIQRRVAFRSTPRTTVQVEVKEMELIASQALYSLSQWDLEIGKRKRDGLTRLTTILVAFLAMDPFVENGKYDQNALTAELLLNYLAFQEKLPPIAFDREQATSLYLEIRELARRYNANKLESDVSPPQVQEIYKKTVKLILNGMAKGARIHASRKIVHLPAANPCMNTFK